MIVWPVPQCFRISQNAIKITRFLVVFVVAVVAVPPTAGTGELMPGRYQAADTPAKNNKGPLLARGRLATRRSGAIWAISKTNDSASFT